MVHRKRKVKCYLHFTYTRSCKLDVQLVDSAKLNAERAFQKLPLVGLSMASDRLMLDCTIPKWFSFSSWNPRAESADKAAWLTELAALHCLVAAMTGHVEAVCSSGNCKPPLTRTAFH